ncbi:hypothetical protein [Candidatus Stoquefichus sp. SB1]|uniref:hypothetical protein n=1 Tax=Candidatus Stoquefichus sp. SB1 TaxID=1658109 RepID=UPI00067F3DFF|nr:hypothetical protein [Candidatus Stoquefichus sp. SB1]
MNIRNYWKYSLEQNAEEMKKYFHDNAYINWHNTNEHFTVTEFIQANCEYPGKWNGEVERIELIDNLIITVVHVYSLEKRLSFHVTSFIKTENDLIISIDEYWGDDGIAPQWRLDKKIGVSIK